jgi:2-polyprenyl-3-methyl-5-hydroxy-6-metoxy-1,4-benzoquinol methylase
MNQKFVETKYDVSRLIDLLPDFNRGRLLDYGCSWGYGVWQYRSAGYDASGFEIAKPKAEFGTTMLGLEIISDHTKLESFSSSSFDFVVASHVLEHLPQIDHTLRLFSRLLRQGGKLVVLVPNSSCRLAQEWRGVWPFMISREHNLAFDAVWFQRNIGRYGFTPLFSSTKFGERFSSALAPYGEDTPAFFRLPDEELLMVATRG